MPIDSLSRARSALHRADAAEVRSNAAYYQGDHWQNGAGWSGPVPEADAATVADLMAEVARGFVSKNAIGEIVDRHVAGVIGNAPHWSLAVARPLAEDEAPTAAEQQRINEAESLLAAWWEDRDVAALLRLALRHALLAGSSCLRLYVPGGFLRDGAVIAESPTEALRQLYPDVPDPLAATIVTDARTRDRTGVYLTTDPETRRQVAEVSTVEDGRTVLRVLAAGGERERAVLDLGGRLPLQQLAVSALVTPQVRQLQMLVNLSLTMLSRNVVLGGFLERVILNGQLPGRFETAPDGTRTWVPEPLRVGAGTTNVLAGLPVYDEAGTVRGYTTPSMVYRDPVSVATFRESRDVGYRAILEESDQLHTLIAGDATASGESRRQAVGDFLTSLLPSKAALDAAGTWLLETALAYAGAFTGEPERYRGLRAAVECRPSAGPIPAEELRLVAELVHERLLSRETAMGRLGVEDIAAELARLQRDHEQAMEHRDDAIRSFMRS